MTDFMVYYKGYWDDLREYGPSVIRDHWYTRSQPTYQKVSPGDDAWVIVQEGDAAWKLLQRIRVRRRRIEAIHPSSYGKYHAIGDPAQGRHFDIAGQPDFTPILSQLQFANGKRTRHRGKRIGLDFQSPRVLSRQAAQLLREYEWSLPDQAKADSPANAESMVIELQEVQAELAIKANSALAGTTKSQLIQARRGQGIFRSNVARVEHACRLTGLTDARFLIASHIKPWKDSSNQERLDGNNGLLLSPHADKLFNDGWISFSDSGELLTASTTVQAVLQSWGLRADVNVGPFRPEQCKYLHYHRGHRYQRPS